STPTLMPGSPMPGRRRAHRGDRRALPRTERLRLPSLSQPGRTALLPRNGFLELLARLEGRNTGCGNLDGHAGGRVDTLAGRPIADFEGSKAHQSHLVALGERVGDGRENNLNRFASHLLGQAGLLGHLRDQLAFVHAVPSSKLEFVAPFLPPLVISFQWAAVIPQT